MDLETGDLAIVDIDGTIADTDHRLHHIYPPAGKKKNWGKFFAEAKNDPPIEHVMRLARMLWLDGTQIVLLTGRPESMRCDTVSWMEKHEFKYDRLLMRPNGDHRQDTIVKRELMQKLVDGKKERIVCAFEDRLHVAEMWREEGIPVLLCNDEWRGKRVSNESVDVVK